MEYDKFRVKVIGIIFDPKKREVLIGRKIGETKYSFVDGNLSHKEELDKGLKRVAKEKTGHDVHNLGAIYARNCLETSKEDKLALYFLCEIENGEEKKGEEVEELIWIKPSQVEEKLKEKLPSRLREYILNLE